MEASCSNTVFALRNIVLAYVEVGDSCRLELCNSGGNSSDIRDWYQNWSSVLLQYIYIYVYTVDVVIRKSYRWLRRGMSEDVGPTIGRVGIACDNSFLAEVKGGWEVCFALS